MTETVTIQLQGAENTLNMLMQLPPEIVSKNGGVVRKALRKGSLVTLKQAKANLQEIINRDGLDDSTGALMKALGTQRARNPERYGAGERFVVHARRAPKVKNVTPAQYGANMELGTEKQVAKPWMTPAYYSTRAQGAQTVIDESNRQIAVIVRKLQGV